MPYTVHRRVHLVDGSKYVDGLSLTTASIYSFTNSSGNWIDEDILHAVPQMTNSRTMYRSGLSTSVLSNIKSQYTMTNGTVQGLMYDANGVLTLVPTSGGGMYVNYWLYVSPLTDNDYVWVAGRLVNATLATVQAENPYNLTGLFPTEEAVLLYKVTLRNSNPPVVTSIQDYRKSTITATSYAPTVHSTLTGRDAADSHPLSAITGYETLVISNTVIRGLGAFLMGESGSTSVLYHITSGNHTNMIGSFYTQ